MPHLRLKYLWILSNPPKLALLNIISLTSYVALSIVTKPLEPPLSVAGFTFGLGGFMTSLRPLRELGEGDEGERLSCLEAGRCFDVGLFREGRHRTPKSKGRENIKRAYILRKV
jgi:hypothetical protein